jgi:hypothetical protein
VSAPKAPRFRISGERLLHAPRPTEQTLGSIPTTDNVLYDSVSTDPRIDVRLLLYPYDHRSNGNCWERWQALAGPGMTDDLLVWLVVLLMMVTSTWPHRVLPDGNHFTAVSSLAEGRELLVK